MERVERIKALIKSLFQSGYYCGYYDGKQGFSGLSGETWENPGGGFWSEGVRTELFSLIDAGREPVGETLYRCRCGWCGAYEGTVDPTEPCASDGEGYIGPHQFGVYERVLHPPTADSEAMERDHRAMEKLRESRGHLGKWVVFRERPDGGIITSLKRVHQKSEMPGLADPADAILGKEE